MRYLFLLFSCLWVSTSFSVERELNYGLFIRSFEVEPKERSGVILNTEYNVEQNSSINFSFELYLRNEVHFFGLISRIRSEKGKYIDLVRTNEKEVSLLVDKTVYRFNVPLEHWFSVDIRFVGATLEITVSGEKKIATYSPKSFQKVAFYFGWFEDPSTGKIVDDVASVNVKDVSVKKDGRLVHLWRFKKHAESGCYDEVESILAKVKNPIWLIDEATQWKRLYLLHTNKIYQYAFNEAENAIYIFDKQKSVERFDLTKEKIGKSFYKNEIVGKLNSSSIADTLNNTVIFFDAYTKNASTLDLKTMTSDCSSYSDKGNELFHIAETLMPETNTFYIFGGCSQQRYYNQLISYQLATRKFNSVQIDSIPPRFHSAMGCLGGDLYVFGGNGNPTGIQMVDPFIYNELYRVNPSTGQAKMLWKNPEQMSYKCAPTMYFEEADSSFIALSAVSGGQLIKLSLKNSEITYLGEAFHKDLNSSYNFLGLYHSKSLNKLYCLIEERSIKTGSEISIYSIAYPPLRLEDVTQQEQTAINMEVSKQHSYIVFFVISVALLLLVSILFFIIKRKKKIQRKVPPKFLNEKTRKNVSQINVNHLLIDFDRSKSSISLLREFTVIDSKGENITKNFSATLKKLFLILLLETKLSPNGVYCHKIDNLIWSDKIDTTANNNRNVSLSKLRLLLGRLGDGCCVSNDGGYLRLNLPQTVFCDFWRIMELLQLIGKQIDCASPMVTELLSLLHHGCLLPNVQEEWMDSYKSQFSTSVMDFMTLILSKIDELTDEQQLLLADVIFIHDSLSEEALSLKCSILRKLGRNIEAKEVYRNFCRQYKSYFGEDYVESAKWI